MHSSALWGRALLARGLGCERCHTARIEHDPWVDTPSMDTLSRAVRSRTQHPLASTTFSRFPWLDVCCPFPPKEPRFCTESGFFLWSGAHMTLKRAFSTKDDGAFSPTTLPRTPTIMALAQ
jgi:hypothetical protein